MDVYFFLAFALISLHIYASNMENIVSVFDNVGFRYWHKRFCQSIQGVPPQCISFIHPIRSYTVWGTYINIDCELNSLETGCILQISKSFLIWVITWQYVCISYSRWTQVTMNSDRCRIFAEQQSALKSNAGDTQRISLLYNRDVSVSPRPSSGLADCGRISVVSGTSTLLLFYIRVYQAKSL